MNVHQQQPRAFLVQASVHFSRTSQVCAALRVTHACICDFRPRGCRGSADTKFKGGTLFIAKPEQKGGGGDGRKGGGGMDPIFKGAGKKGKGGGKKKKGGGGKGGGGKKKGGGGRR